MSNQKEERSLKKNCDLCKMEARTLCESDEASLCWKCDSKVHGANFLVARHTRHLLCALCHSPTSWSASGPYLTRSLSVCHRCISVNAHRKGKGENQVVPLSSHSPPTSSSSSTTQDHETGDDELEGVHRPSLKRPRQPSTNLRSSSILRKEKGGSGLTRKDERSEAERRVEWCLRGGTDAKRFRRSFKREECEGLEVDSSENGSRTI